MSGKPIARGTIAFEKTDLNCRVDYGEGFNTKLTPHAIRIFSDGRFVYANADAPFEENPILSTNQIQIQYFVVGDEEKSSQRCLVINCQTLQTNQTAHVRMVASETELLELLNILKKISPDNNIDSILQEGRQSTERTRSILFDQSNVMFTSLRERKYLFSMMWKSWAPRTIKIYSDGTLTYTHPYMQDAPEHHTLKLTSVEVALFSDGQLHAGTEEANFGLSVKCQTLKGMDTYFRCIISNQQILDDFLWAMKTVATTHNVEKMSRTSLANLPQQQSNNRLRLFAGMPKSSAMRRAVCRSIDKHQKQSLHEAIVNKRGVMKWLPVIGSNDLVHGSWWFFFGSIGVIGTSAVMVANRYNTLLTDDDSTLSKQDFIATWILICISGFFCTLGSLAFVRAFHEDPPMTPLFTWYHVQSDELVASWSFFCATIPFVPYCLIYLQSNGYNSLLFLVALGFAIVASLGTLLFVRACYPSDKTYKNIMLPISNYLCCCMCKGWREKHLVNDWLGASWFFFLGSLIVSVICGLILIVVWVTNDPILTFMYGTSFLECIAFTVGSAYFVAGSYPENISISSSHKSSDVEMQSSMPQGATANEETTANEQMHERTTE